MELNIEPAAIEKITPYVQPDDRLYLDFEDGVGPFPATEITCRLDIHFRLIIVPQSYPEEGLAIYDTPLTTPLGTIWLKQGAQVYLEEQTRLQVEPTYQRLQLVGNSGILANDVQLLRIEKQTAGH